jgi:dTDP-4-dehydrorhamnose reductase
VRLLLTGGGGLLGKPLEAVLSVEHDVLATDLAELDLPALDVTRPADVAEALRDFRPERVAHLAAWTDVDGCERDPARADAVNAEGTRVVADACAAAGIPLLYVSTDYVFDGNADREYRETDAPNPLSAYGASKLRGEEYVRAAGGTWRIVRCQSIYGRGRKSFPDAILARAEAGNPLSVVTDQVVSPSFAGDLAEAVAAVLLRAPGGIYHAANSGSCTWYECARAVLDLTGHEDVPIAPISAAELGRPAPRPAMSRFDCAKLAGATGVVLRPWRDALEAYLAGVAKAGNPAP